MESHSENQQLVAAENQESDSAAAPGGQQEIQSEPGYRFWPTDEEIIVHYLRRKIADPEFKSRAIPDKEDISSFDPWELYVGRKTSQEHVFFFTKKTIMTNQRGKKLSRYRDGKGGCWSLLETETWIYSDCEGSNLSIGEKATYRFCTNPGMIKTNWKMMEYGLPGNKPLDWVVCRVFTKGGGKVDPPEKWPAASGSSITAPTDNLQQSQRSKQTATTSFTAGPVVSNYDSMRTYTRPAMLQQDVQRGYNLNQPQINMATQQQQGPVNTHSDEQRVFNHNQQPVNMPNTTLQGPHGPAHPASTMVPYSYSMANQQQLPGPNLQSDVGSITGTRTLGWTFNPNFTQQFYNHNQQPFDMPILQRQYHYQPPYPANNMLSTDHYNMENQQLPGITTPPILPPDVGSTPNPRHIGGNYDQSSVPPQGSDSETFLQEWQPSKYRKI